MKKTLAHYSWIWLVLGYVLIVGAFCTMVYIAIRLNPQSVPLEHYER